MSSNLASPHTQKRVVVIAKPRAGGGRAVRLVHEGRRRLWGRSFEAYFPETPSALSAVCAAIETESTEAVIVIGGDGTLNRVIQELRRHSKSVPLYPFAGGTANDLAKELGAEPDWSAVESALNHYQPQSQNRMDLIEVNGVPFATVAGIGVGARITQELNAGRETSRILQLGLKGFKKQTYSLLSLKSILTHASIDQEIRIESGSFNQTLRSPAVFICNQNRLSGSIRVAHQNENNDGKFSVLVIPEMNRLRLVAALAQLNMGRIPSAFISFAADRLKIRSTRGRALQVFGDGETLVNHTQLDFKVLPKALSVLQNERRLS